VYSAPLLTVPGSSKKMANATTMQPDGRVTTEAMHRVGVALERLVAQVGHMRLMRLVQAERTWFADIVERFFLFLWVAVFVAFVFSLYAIVKGVS